MSEVKTENEQVQLSEEEKEKVGIFKFRKVRLIKSAMSEVQRGAFRMLDDSRINSLPQDLEIELANAINKMKRVTTPSEDAIDNIAKRNGMIPKGSIWKFKSGVDENVKDIVMGVV